MRVMREFNIVCCDLDQRLELEKVGLRGKEDYFTRKCTIDLSSIIFYKETSFEMDGMTCPGTSVEFDNGSDFLLAISYKEFDKVFCNQHN